MAGSLLNAAGVLSPGDGMGTLHVNGSFAQFEAGTLDLELGAAGADLLAIDGVAILGGTLKMTFLDGFSGIGTYALITAGNCLGLFSSVLVSGLDNSLVASVSYGNTGLNVAAVPEAETYALLLACMGFVGWAARRRRNGARG